MSLPLYLVTAVFSLSLCVSPSLSWKLFPINQSNENGNTRSPTVGGCVVVKKSSEHPKTRVGGGPRLASLNAPTSLSCLPFAVLHPFRRSVFCFCLFPVPLLLPPIPSSFSVPKRVARTNACRSFSTSASLSPAPWISIQSFITSCIHGSMRQCIPSVLAIRSPS